MGHIAHLRKQFISINTYDYIWLYHNIDLENKIHIISFMTIQWFKFSFDQTWISQGCGALHFNKLESPSPKDALCQVWLKLAQWFWKRRWKCKKFTTTLTTTTTTDKFWTEKLTWESGTMHITNWILHKEPHYCCHRRLVLGLDWWPGLTLPTCRHSFTFTFSLSFCDFGSLYIVESNST